MSEQTISFKIDLGFQVERITLQQSWFRLLEPWGRDARWLQGGDGEELQVRTEKLWCFAGAVCSSQPAPCLSGQAWPLAQRGIAASTCWMHLPEGKHPVLCRRGALLLSGKCQHEWDIGKESSALKWSFPILTLKPWETAGVSSVLKQDGHRNFRLLFTETFPRQQLLCPVKPPELIKLRAARVLMSQVPQTSDRLVDEMAPSHLCVKPVFKQDQLQMEQLCGDVRSEFCSFKSVQPWLDFATWWGTEMK